MKRQLLLKNLRSLAVRAGRKLPLIRRHHRYLNDLEFANKIFSQVERADFDLPSGVALLLRFGIDIRGLKQVSTVPLLQVLSNREINTRQYETLLVLVNNVAEDATNCRSWLALNRLLCLRGRYRLAGLCREKARLLAIKPIFERRKNPPISWENSVAAGIEGGEITSTQLLENLIYRIGCTTSGTRRWRQLFYTLYGKSLSGPFSLPESHGYREFLEHKSVAIVGPAPTENMDATEIDGRQAVIRMNYSATLKCCDDLHKGKNTHASYFNGEQAGAIRCEQDGKLPRELEWACFKSSNAALLFEQLNPELRCRETYRFDGECSFHGSYNMIPLVVLDLALLGVSNAKIFHTDLMLTRARAKNYYPESFGRDDENAAKIFRISSMVHDPVLQYRTLNRLWERGKLDGDEAFSRVMEMGLNQYLFELERAYAESSHAKE